MNSSGGLIEWAVSKTDEFKSRQRGEMRAERIPEKVSRQPQQEIFAAACFETKDIKDSAA